jgi:hypothetical protein
MVKYQKMEHCWVVAIDLKRWTFDLLFGKTKLDWKVGAATNNQKTIIPKDKIHLAELNATLFFGPLSIGKLF